VRSTVDYYDVLHITRGASNAEIKAAYRTAAKAAHPDAGGSTHAMELVNEAYAALSDPITRRSYDAPYTEVRTSPPHPPRSEPMHQPPTSPRPKRAPHVTGAYTVRYHPSVVAYARFSALRITGYNLMAAVLLGFVTSFMVKLTPNTTSRVILALVAFIPVYLSAVGIVFFIIHRLRIALAQLGVAHVPPKRDLLGLTFISLFAVPSAGIWLLGYFKGIWR
jgi:hypothetical protein